MHDIDNYKTRVHNSSDWRLRSSKDHFAYVVLITRCDSHRTTKLRSSGSSLDVSFRWLPTERQTLTISESAGIGFVVSIKNLGRTEETMI